MAPPGHGAALQARPRPVVPRHVTRAVASGFPRRSAVTSRVRRDGGAGEQSRAGPDGRVLPAGVPVPQGSLSRGVPVLGPSLGSRLCGPRAVSQPVPIRR